MVKTNEAPEEHGQQEPLKFYLTARARCSKDKNLEDNKKIRTTKKKRKRKKMKKKRKMKKSSNKNSNSSNNHQANNKKEKRNFPALPALPCWVGNRSLRSGVVFWRAEHDQESVTDHPRLDEAVSAPPPGE